MWTQLVVIQRINKQNGDLTEAFSLLYYTVYFRSRTTSRQRLHYVNGWLFEVLLFQKVHKCNKPNSDRSLMWLLICLSSLFLHNALFINFKLSLWQLKCRAEMSIKKHHALQKRQWDRRGFPRSSEELSLFWKENVAWWFRVHIYWRSGTITKRLLFLQTFGLHTVIIHTLWFKPWSGTISFGKTWDLRRNDWRYAIKLTQHSRGV